MKQNSIIEVLIDRDEMSLDEVMKYFKQIKRDFNQQMMEPDFDAGEFLMDNLGLEEDYVFDLI